MCVLLDKYCWYLVFFCMRQDGFQKMHHPLRKLCSRHASFKCSTAVSSHVALEQSNASIWENNGKSHVRQGYGSQAYPTCIPMAKLHFFVRWANAKSCTNNFEKVHNAALILRNLRFSIIQLFHGTLAMPSHFSIAFRQIQLFLQSCP